MPHPAGEHEPLCQLNAVIGARVRKVDHLGPRSPAVGVDNQQIAPQAWQRQREGSVVVGSAPIERLAGEPECSHDRGNRLPGCLHHPAMSNDLGVLTRLPDGRGLAGQQLCLSDRDAHPFGHEPGHTAADQRGDSSEPNTSWNAAKAGTCCPATVTVTKERSAAMTALAVDVPSARSSAFSPFAEAFR